MLDLAQPVGFGLFLFSCLIAPVEFKDHLVLIVRDGLFEIGHLGDQVLHIGHLDLQFLYLRRLLSKRFCLASHLLLQRGDEGFILAPFLLQPLEHLRHLGHFHWLSHCLGHFRSPLYWRDYIINPPHRQRVRLGLGQRQSHCTR